MNRRDFQKLAQIRVQEAKALLHAALYDGAYYLAGYAVECALKACIAKQTRRYDFPDRDVVNRSYTHNLEALIGVAGMRTDLEQKMKTDQKFAVNWAVVKDWSEDARYQRKSKAEAELLVRAVADTQTGILEWIRAFW